MPLTIGITLEKANENGITETERMIANSFEFGIVCMHAGVCELEGTYYGTNYKKRPITIDEVLERFTVVENEFKVLEKTHRGEGDEKINGKDFILNKDNLIRLHNAGWECNAGWKSSEEFIWHMGRLAVENVFKNTEHLGYEQTYDTYDDYLKRKRVPAHVVGMLLTGEKKMFYDTDKEFAEMIIEEGNMYDQYWNKSFYQDANGTDWYLHWHDDGTFTIDTSKQEE